MSQSKPVRTERQQQLIDKYTTTKGLDEIGSIFDIVGDVLGILDNVANPLSWYDLFSDGASLVNMDNSNENAQQILKDLQSQMGTMSQTVDQIKAEMAAQGATQAEINAKVSYIMDQQAMATQQILGSINQVASMINMAWGSTVQWLSNLQQQLGVMSEMMVGMAAGLQESLQEMMTRIEQQFDQLGIRVDWGAIVSTVTEYESRIKYACEMATNIQLDKASDSDDAPATQYSPQELDEWARKTADLATGLGYYLTALDRLIMGSMLNRPLPLTYFRLFNQYRAPTDPINPKAARLFGYLVALQAQGYGVLSKAREFLGLNTVDTTQLLDQRVKAQAAVIQSAYIESMGVAGNWLGHNGPDFSFPYLGERREDRYVMTPSNKHVACSIYARQEGNTPLLYLEYGTVRPGGTTENAIVDYEGGQYMDFNGQAAWLGHSVFWDDQRLGKPYLWLTPDKITVGPQYAIVGIKLEGTSGDYPKFMPIVSKFNPSTGTTEWSGKGGGGIYLARVSSNGIRMPCEKAQFHVGCEDTKYRTFGMLRGTQLFYGDYGVKVCYQSTGLSRDTWLPFEYPETPNITYEPITL